MAISAVVVDIGKDALGNSGVFLHLTAFVECEGTGLLEQSGGKPDLPNVVNETAKMCHLLFLRRQSEALGNVACVDRDGS